MVKKNFRTRARSGNLVIVVMLIAVVASLLAAALTASARSAQRASNMTDSVAVVYDGLAIADIFADAFLSDLDMQYRQEPVPVGTLTIDNVFYEQMIENAKGFTENMNMVLQPDGRYLYKGNAQMVAEDIAFDNSFAGNGYRPENMSMESRFWQRVTTIDTFYIYIDQKLTPDPAHPDNILDGDTGDRYYLKDVVLELHFTVGLTQFYQQYRIQNLYAEFTHIGTILCDIQTDEAIVTMEAQTVA